MLFWPCIFKTFGAWVLIPRGHLVVSLDIEQRPAVPWWIHGMEERQLDRGKSGQSLLDRHPQDDRMNKIRSVGGEGF